MTDTTMMTLRAELEELPLADQVERWRDARARLFTLRDELAEAKLLVKEAALTLETHEQVIYDCSVQRRRAA